jgi:hypothetical protein
VSESERVNKERKSRTTEKFISIKFLSVVIVDECSGKILMIASLSWLLNAINVYI